MRQDLPSFGDYLLNQGGIIDSYYEDGTAAIKYNGNLYPAYTAPKKEQETSQSTLDKVKEWTAKDQQENKELILNAQAGYQQSLIERNELLGESMFGAENYPFTEEATIKNYNSESLEFKLGKIWGTTEDYAGFLNPGSGTNAIKNGVGKGTTGTGKLPGENVSKAGYFESSISKLPAGERVAAVKIKAAEVAEQNGWVKDKTYSKVNNRDIYKDPKSGDLYSLDTQHGRFEKCNSKGKHQGEINMDLLQTKPADSTGGHNLIVK